jgi:hypothetical protein
MSACISRHGEYSAHTVGDDFYCEFCGAFDEQAAVTDAYERGRKEQAAADRERIEALLHPERGMGVSVYGDGRRFFDEADVRAALDSEGGA